MAGQAILITGAARGIGAASARALAARGHRLALAGLEPEELERVAAGCPGSVALEADVTEPDSLQAAVDGAVAALGGIDTVIANAGIASVGFVRTMDPEAFERTLEVNLVGTWRTVRAALPHVIERRGYVLPVASLAAIAHSPGMAAYSASKAGVEAFADALRAEVKPFGVKVGVAYFSWIDTDMVRGTDATTLGGAMRAKLKGPLARTYPVADAADAIVRGVERRSRVVTAPGWIKGVMAVRGLVQPVADLALRASEVREFDAMAEREAGSGPVGAGGAADAARVRQRA
jgi:NAD(P)-dependent dehydrogenase (short-subunit alcohol dehydrogenase family)